MNILTMHLYFHVWERRKRFRKELVFSHIWPRPRGYWLVGKKITIEISNPINASNEKMRTTVIVVFMGDSGNLKIYWCIFDEPKSYGKMGQGNIIQMLTMRSNHFCGLNVLPKFHNIILDQICPSLPFFFDIYLFILPLTLCVLCSNK